MRVPARRVTFYLSIGIVVALSLVAEAPQPQPQPQRRPRPVRPVGPVVVPIRLPHVGNQHLMVRGYIAARPSTQRQVETTAFALASTAKDIYLPGVEVYLLDPQTNGTSKSVKTDLSGRFTLFAPKVGRYHICWKSPVYGAGCQTNFVSAGSAPQFVSTVRIVLRARRNYTAIAGHVTSGDGTIPRTFDPLFNINSFAMVHLEDAKGTQIAEVYVNNFGDYLIPYVPAKTESQCCRNH